jgi:hypothetical protein
MRAPFSLGLVFILVVGVPVARDGSTRSVDAAQTGALSPNPIKSSDLRLRLDLVGTIPTHTNPTSPTVAGSVLLLVDQGGYVYRWDATGSRALLTPSDVPAGITPIGAEAVLNVAANTAGDKIFVVFTSSTAPRGVPRRVSTRPGADAWQVLHRYDFNGTALSNPTAIAAWQVRTDGHTGGGLVVLNDGTVLLATGDNGDAYEDGRGYAQDGGSHLSKILRINPADGTTNVVAMGVRNVQRLAVYQHDGDPRLDFIDVGGIVAEELNSIRVADLAEPSGIRNFGWGRSPVDGKAREGTFYINPSGVAVGSAPTPEAGFIQPIAQFGREGATLFAGTGPVSSAQSLTRITSLFGDLPGGAVYAVTGPLSQTGQDVFHVALVNSEGQAVNLKDLAGGARPDPRFFNFPDGTAGVLLERTGAFYRLTELPPPAPARTQVPDQFFDSNGVRIHCTDQGSGEPVVLVHGVDGGMHSWTSAGVLQNLAKNYRVIALDCRGHGLSGKPHDPKQYGAEMAVDIARLLDHVGVPESACGRILDGCRACGVIADTAVRSGSPRHVGSWGRTPRVALDQ